jgi:hypothetical protein
VDKRGSLAFLQPLENVGETVTEMLPDPVGRMSRSSLNFSDEEI